ncbi:hypothetical protein BB561_002351 [Smittium simulii]|uniref:SH3 domain-containing protein n=1 Tax=Smittium simulii TaxID=133385 RepID=A0A2T9YQS2_9FUNG|nr:hypothetical protein BB561_002351 [Smittium simulii]
MSDSTTLLKRLSNIRVFDGVTRYTTRNSQDCATSNIEQCEAPASEYENIYNTTQPPNDYSYNQDCQYDNNNFYNTNNVSDRELEEYYLALEAKIEQELLEAEPYLDFSKYYAVYSVEPEFPGQIAIIRNDLLNILDDSDPNGDLWLVRNLRTNQIGLVEVDSIESATERLARTNTFKNIKLCLDNINHLSSIIKPIKTKKYVTFPKDVVTDSVSIDSIPVFSDESSDFDPMLDSHSDLDLYYPNNTNTLPVSASRNRPIDCDQLNTNPHTIPEGSLSQHYNLSASLDSYFYNANTATNLSSTNQSSDFSLGSFERTNSVLDCNDVDSFANNQSFQTKNTSDSYCKDVDSFANNQSFQTKNTSDSYCKDVDSFSHKIYVDVDVDRNSRGSFDWATSVLNKDILPIIDQPERIFPKQDDLFQKLPILDLAVSDRNAQSSSHEKQKMHPKSNISINSLFQPPCVKTSDNQNNTFNNAAFDSSSECKDKLQLKSSANISFDNLTKRQNEYIDEHNKTKTQHHSTKPEKNLSIDAKCEALASFSTKSLINNIQQNENSNKSLINNKTAYSIKIKRPNQNQPKQNLSELSTTEIKTIVENEPTEKMESLNVSTEIETDTSTINTIQSNAAISNKISNESSNNQFLLNYTSSNLELAMWFVVESKVLSKYLLNVPKSTLILKIITEYYSMSKSASSGYSITESYIKIYLGNSKHILVFESEFKRIFDRMDIDTLLSSDIASNDKPSTYIESISIYIHLSSCSFADMNQFQQNNVFYQPTYEKIIEIQPNSYSRVDDYNNSRNRITSKFIDSYNSTNNDNNVRNSINDNSCYSTQLLLPADRHKHSTSEQLYKNRTSISFDQNSVKSNRNSMILKKNVSTEYKTIINGDSNLESNSGFESSRVLCANRASSCFSVYKQNSIYISEESLLSLPSLCNENLFSEHLSSINKTKSQKTLYIKPQSQPKSIADTQAQTVINKEHNADESQSSEHDPIQTTSQISNQDQTRVNSDKNRQNQLIIDSPVVLQSSKIKLSNFSTPTSKKLHPKSKLVLVKIPITHNKNIPVDQTALIDKECNDENAISVTKDNKSSVSKHGLIALEDDQLKYGYNEANILKPSQTALDISKKNRSSVLDLSSSSIISHEVVVQPITETTSTLSTKQPTKSKLQKRLSLSVLVKPHLKNSKCSQKAPSPVLGAVSQTRTSVIKTRSNHNSIICDTIDCSSENILAHNSNTEISGNTLVTEPRLATNIHHVKKNRTNMNESARRTSIVTKNNYNIDNQKPLQNEEMRNDWEINLDSWMVLTNNRTIEESDYSIVAYSAIYQGYIQKKSNYNYAAKNQQIKSSDSNQCYITDKDTILHKMFNNDEFDIGNEKTYGLEFGYDYSFGSQIPAIDSKYSTDGGTLTDSESNLSQLYRNTSHLSSTSNQSSFENSIFSSLTPTSSYDRMVHIEPQQSIDIEAQQLNSEQRAAKNNCLFGTEAKMYIDEVLDAIKTISTQIHYLETDLALIKKIQLDIVGD